MRVRLEYGRSGLDVELPDERVSRVLSYKAAPPLPDPAAALEDVLRAPLGAAPLVEIARGRRTACVLICDITRPVPNALLLAPVLRALEAAGLRRSDILILVATGLHRANVGAELEEMVGADILSQYRVENHDGLDAASHVFLGASPRGVPIHIDRRYVEADVKIATGLIEPHFMAGYSGGRKLICPGIASLETIKTWHGPSFIAHPRADSGVLEWNPIHEENTWIARRVGCDFIVNVVIDAQRRPLKFVAGDMIAAFEAGARFVSEVVVDSLPAEVEVVVTSGAGYPLDTTFYQSIKGVVAAAPVVKPGGDIIIAASLGEGVGSPQFASLFEEHASLEAFHQRVFSPDYFVMDQWQLQELHKARRKARVTYVSDGLPAATLRKLFVEAAPSVEAAVEDALARHGPAARVAVIPKGPYVLARVA